LETNSGQRAPKGRESSRQSILETFYAQKSTLQSKPSSVQSSIEAKVMHIGSVSSVSEDEHLESN